MGLISFRILKPYTHPRFGSFQSLGNVADRKPVTGMQLIHKVGLLEGA